MIEFVDWFLVLIVVIRRNSCKVFWGVFLVNELCLIFEFFV